MRRGGSAGVDKRREEHVNKIRAAQAELAKAGPIHRRDLRRHLRRLQSELRAYDRYRKEQVD